MELTFAAATDVGRQRTHNEDNFLIDKKLRLFLVADGMGGHAAGEVASSIAVHEIRDAVHNSRDLIDRYRVDHPGVQGYEILQVLEHAIQSACTAVHTRAQAEPDKRGMGTTARSRTCRARCSTSPTRAAATTTSPPSWSASARPRRPRSRRARPRCRSSSRS